jgi:hypothetical protein
MAIALPIPRADPVTNATLFLRLAIFDPHNAQLNNVEPRDRRVDSKKPLTQGLLALPGDVWKIITYHVVSTLERQPA